MKVIFNLKNGQTYGINMAHVSMISTNKRASIGDRPVDHVTITLITGARIELADATFEEIHKLWDQTHTRTCEPSSSKQE